MTFRDLKTSFCSSKRDKGDKSDPEYFKGCGKYREVSWTESSLDRMMDYWEREDEEND